ncbi:MAG: biopolymer transporter ExbD [candidate division KSB1 bacterium]|nr:biopolymer transporter ExbD [candidate division KSB1 bacterium]
MTRGSMIIRFIDIALTVLFGFIAVSEIEHKTQIKLPHNVAAATVPTHVNTISILVLDGPRYTLLDGPQMVISDSDLYRVEQALLAVRQKYLERHQDVLVLIQPDPNSPIQLTVNVLDICERNHIVKNINYVEPGV